MDGFEEAFLTERVTIRTRLRESDGAGGFREVTHQLTDIAARVHPSDPQESEIDGRRVRIQTALIKLPVSVRVSTKDSILQGATAWEVIGTDDLRTDRALAHVEVRRIVP